MKPGDKIRVVHRLSGEFPTYGLRESDIGNLKGELIECCQQEGEYGRVWKVRHTEGTLMIPEIMMEVIDG